MASDQEIRRIIKAALLKFFPKVQLVSIDLRDVLDDEDGSHALEISVVFDAKEKDVTAKKIPAFVNTVIAEFDHIDDQRFPVFSFISESDWKEPAAA